MPSPHASLRAQEQRCGEHCRRHLATAGAPKAGDSTSMLDLGVLDDLRRRQMGAHVHAHRA